MLWLIEDADKQTLVKTQEMVTKLKANVNFLAALAETAMNIGRMQCESNSSFTVAINKTKFVSLY